MSVGEIESDVAKLSREDLRAFTEWFEEFSAEAWDRQFEADVKARAFASRFEAFHDARFLVSLRTASC